MRHGDLLVPFVVTKYALKTQNAWSIKTTILKLGSSIRLESVKWNKHDDWKTNSPISLSANWLTDSPLLELPLLLLLVLLATLPLETTVRGRSAARTLAFWPGKFLRKVLVGRYFFRRMFTPGNVFFCLFILYLTMSLPWSRDWIWVIWFVPGFGAPGIIYMSGLYVVQKSKCS